MLQGVAQKDELCAGLLDCGHHCPHVANTHHPRLVHNDNIPLSQLDGALLDVDEPASDGAPAVQLSFFLQIQGLRPGA
ncbi:MAG: hypothetical protein ACD_10C00062G0001 [uncultured bacterium]|nr:MAG: hypothetical protein ACD_10C00062G0001 [uncultured bacterium]